MSENGLTWTNGTRKLSELTPQHDNPRQIRKEKAKRLVKSWHKFNQPDVISIGPDNKIYNGHQRYYVWQAAYGNAFEVAVRIASRPLTKREWQEFTVMMHEGTVAEWDFDMLANWEGVDVGDLVEWGFEAWQLGGVGEGDNIDELWRGMPEFEQDDCGPVKTISIHFAATSDIATFSELIEQNITDKTKYIWYPEQERKNLKGLLIQDEP